MASDYPRPRTRAAFAVLLVWSTTILLPLPGRAEPVYMRQDKGGTLSFSNVPTGEGYDRAPGNEPSPAPRTSTPARANNAVQEPTRAPVAAPLTRDFVNVFGGGEQVKGAIVGLKADGTVWAWGRTIGPVARLACQQQIPGLTDVRAVHIGNAHAVALKNDGTVASWGMNNNGELGADGPARDVPAPVAGLDQVKAVSAGGNHTLVLRRDGTVWAWGENIFGELGDGTSTRVIKPPEPKLVREGITLRYELPPPVQRGRAKPTPVTGLDDVSAVAAGGYHSLALKRDGTVWAWGSNQHGQLGIGTNEHQSSPVQVRLDGVQAIGAGTEFSVALRADGSVWAWGNNRWGQLGDSSGNSRTTPGPIEGLTHVSRIVTGGTGGVAIREDGSLWVWGVAYYAPPEGKYRPEPMPVTIVREPIESVALAVGRTVILRQDGSLWYWGTRPGFVAPNYDD